MSYLDTPRLHFTGTFTANPSTINNDNTNYGYNPATQPPILINLNWNPYGSHAFTISANVTSFVDSSGQLHTDGDPLIGASFASYIPDGSFSGKIVDLDTEQQNVTRWFGLSLQLIIGDSKTSALQGLWQNGGTLVNLWTRVPSFGNSDPDGAAGGAFQSVLQNLVWQDVGASKLLQQLQQAVGDSELSVRLNLFGYQDHTTDPGFRTGLISGTIGPYSKGEPLHLAPRLLLPFPPSTSPQPMAWAPAKVNSQKTTVTIDLGNSIPDKMIGGTPAFVCPPPLAPPQPPPTPSPCTMQAVVFSGATPTVLGSIEYLEPTFQKMAGVVQFPITAEQAGQPLAILVKDSSDNSLVPLMESSDGQYIDVDGSSLYMNPGGEASVNIWATSFGSPAAGVPVDLVLVANGDNNLPASALAFPASVTTGTDGSAPIPLQAPNPFPASEMPQTRQTIGGQVYFIGGSWQANNVGPAPLSVKLFNSITPPISNPVWSDVQPILYRFYYMYGFMASIVDLSNYDEVKANAQSIQQVLSLGFDDPGYMPVSREMANDERQLILNWIDQGCPKGNDDTTTTTDFAVSSGSGSTGAGPERPWKG